MYRILKNELKNYNNSEYFKESKYQFNGKPVPRVTEILSTTIHEDYLMKWANFLGFKHLDYEKELNKAAHEGTKAHNYIEEFFTRNPYDPLSEGMMNNPPFLAFHKWWQIIIDNSDEFK